MARKEFAEHYNSYIELIYVICKGDLLKREEALKLSTNDFLFLGEYLIRKRDVENIK